MAKKVTILGSKKFKKTNQRPLSDKSARKCVLRNFDFFDLENIFSKFLEKFVTFFQNLWLQVTKLWLFLENCDFFLKIVTFFENCDFLKIVTSSYKIVTSSHKIVTSSHKNYDFLKKVVTWSLKNFYSKTQPRVCFGWNFIYQYLNCLILLP